MILCRFLSPTSKAELLRRSRRLLFSSCSYFFFSPFPHGNALSRCRGIPGSPIFVSQLLTHPFAFLINSSRPLATFFLGLVFLSCIQLSVHAPLALLRRHRRHATVLGGLEANRSQEKVNSWLNTHPSTRTFSSHAHRPLSINIAFGMAAVAQFGSLLVFSPSQLGGCGQSPSSFFLSHVYIHVPASSAFLVAWSGMAGQCARLLGLLKLSLDMKKLGVNRWELHASWLVGFASIGKLAPSPSLSGTDDATVIMFVNNSISVGVLK